MTGMLRRSPNSMSPRLCVKAWSKGKSAFARDERGQTLVEFALVLPLLLLVLTGIITFGILFWNQVTLTNATAVAAQVAAVSRASLPTDVCGPVNTALYQAATGLNNPSIYGNNPLTFSILVSGKAIQGTVNGQQQSVSSNIAVNGAGVSACPVQLTQGEEISVSTTYGCQLNYFGSNFGSNCKLSAQTAEAVQ